MDSQRRKIAQFDVFFGELNAVSSYTCCSEEQQNEARSCNNLGDSSRRCVRDMCYKLLTC